jgi:diguanylate cyclase (GGDEF)-like protein
VVATIGLSVALVTAISAPFGFALVAYRGKADHLAYMARLDAGRVAKFTLLHGPMWPLHRLGVAEIIEFTDGAGENVRKRVLTSNGGIVHEEGEPLPLPIISRSEPIVADGTIVGKVEVEASLRPMLLETATVGLFSFLLGFAAYFAVRIFPLRMLDRTLGELDVQNERFKAALKNMRQGLVMFDGSHRLIVCNDPYLKLYNLPGEAIRPGITINDLVEQIAIVSGSTANLEQLIAERLAVIEAGKPQAFTRELSGGRVISIAHQPLPQGGWVATHDDITERKQAEARIAHMARHDTLTDLPNRAHFRERLDEALSRIQRYGGRLSVLSVDLDRFKEVNDSLGHPIGDKLLREAAGRLRNCAREVDIVARFGGDEFAVLQTGLQRPEDASALAHRIVQAVSEPYEIEGHSLVIGASVGIATAPADGGDADQLIRNADMALYRAKAEGRGTFCFFEAEMNERAQARRALELDLREALEQGEFELYYQPLVNVRTGDVTGFEALLRWIHPERGLVSPAEFIPLAEEIGVIVPLGEWVLRQACREAAGWPAGMKVAVNLSPIQFRSRNLVQAVIVALAVSKLPASRLELEITESVLLQETDTTLATLHQLRSLGVRISMDDFGTGYSSLNYLRSFPFDKIKIDRSFIGDLAANADCEAIVRAVTGLGSSLGMTTTAEGVETRDQLEKLRAEGCTEVQGYYFSAPRPATEIPALMAAVAALKPAA